MPSDRKVLVFRPDDKELDMIEFLLEKVGPPTSRIVAVAVREKADRDGYRPGWRESVQLDEVEKSEEHG